MPMYACPAGGCGRSIHCRSGYWLAGVFAVTDAVPGDGPLLGVWAGAAVGAGVGAGVGADGPAAMPVTPDPGGGGDDPSVTVICVSARTVVVPCASTWALMTRAPAPSVPVPQGSSPPNRQYFAMFS